MQYAVYTPNAWDVPKCPFAKVTPHYTQSSDSHTRTQSRTGTQFERTYWWRDRHGPAIFPENIAFADVSPTFFCYCFWFWHWSLVTFIGQFWHPNWWLYLPPSWKQVHSLGHRAFKRRLSFTKTLAELLRTKSSKMNCKIRFTDISSQDVKGPDIMARTKVKFV